MDNASPRSTFSDLSTALIADAAVRLKVPLRAIGGAIEE
jgi:hypothetical protein